MSAVLSFAARYEGVWQPGVISLLREFAITVVPFKIIILIAFGMYRRLWRYASVTDLEVLLAAAFCCGAIDVIFGNFLLVPLGISTQPVSHAVIVLDACLGGMFIAATRLGIRMLARRDRGSTRVAARRAVIVGAGAAGGMIVRELAENPQLGLLPVAIVDDNRSKHGLRMHNVPVLGSLNDLADVASRVSATDVVIAIPSATGRTVRNVVQLAAEAGLSTRTVPGLYELVSGEKRVDALRQVAIEDLLGREPVHTDTAQVASLVADRTVMVTGAGGSIGRELCRQLARLKPSRIIAVGRGENSIFELLQEMERTFPELQIIPVITDVRDCSRMRRAMSEYRPFSVFHAAAHKHVPLMEANVAEAVLNNVLGTQNVSSLAMQFGVEHFVLISTDKAVRPTSVMGVTKRIAEHLVHQCAIESRRGYVAVRFGNVLGSRGSVVPTFLRQIADGGPITITHRDMTRYFMTIPEAVQLVLQAAALGRHGEVFVLDMGEPVRIYDLATDLIRLSGLEPEVDIEVRVTGTRPGEKLYEELFFAGADVTPTIHPKILRARDAEASEHSTTDVEALIAAAQEGRSPSKIRRLMLKIVPEYAGEVESVEYQHAFEHTAGSIGVADAAGARARGDDDDRAVMDELALARLARARA